MPSQAYMCRVGGLTVALGVGAAIISGWSGGVAWADDSPGSAASSASSNEAGPDTATATTGADVSDPDDKADSEPTTKPPDPTETVAAAATGDDEDSPSRSARSDRSDRVPTTPKKRTPAREQTVDAVDPPTNVVSDASEPANVVPDATLPTGSTAPLRTASIQTPAPAPPTPPKPSPVRVVSRLVSEVVTAVLSPFAASSTPRVPADPPSMWAVLAFARREFESAVRSLFPAATPANRQTTSESPGGDPGVQPEQRTLILTAFPAEADAILARTTLDPNPTVVVDGRRFYLGSMGGKKVIVAMTGIGMVNATDTTEAALAHFTPESGISISAVVFAGVAGGYGRTEIGSVAVPARWTSDDGATWRPVDPGMLAAANTLTVDLDSTARLGDPLCLCSPLARLPLIDLNREPQLFVGGDGSSDDNNNGVAFPAIPLGGDVFGPQPCTAPDRSPLFIGNFLQAVGPFLAFGLLSNLTGLLTDVPPPVDAVDMETAAAQQVADAHGVPFLGIRGMSDGPGDPLNLPGYPFTFFVYKQVAADNAAIVTEAFLQNWDGAPV